jgi:hypothetical protein
MKYLFIGVILLSFVIRSGAQDTLTAYEREKLRFYKLQNEMLEIRLGILEQRLIHYLGSVDNQLAADMEELHLTVSVLRDSILHISGRITQPDAVLSEETGRYAGKWVSNKWPSPSAVYALHPVGLIRGMFEVSLERAVSGSWSLEFSMMGTYVTHNSFGQEYLKNQDFTAFDPLLNIYVPYRAEMFTGFGLALRAKHFPWHHVDPVSFSAPLGVYAAPVFQYRYYDIRGERERWVNGMYVKDDLVRHLNSFGVGVMFGYQFPLLQVLALDISAGGIIRVSKYAGEDHFTRYKKWSNIDYSGVLPTATIRLSMIR